MTDETLAIVSEPFGGFQGPVHLLGGPQDVRTLCGRDVKRREAWPFLLACHEPLFRDRALERGLAWDVCTDCFVAAGS